MGTGVVDGVKSPADVEHRDAIAVDLHRGGFARRQVRRVRYFHQFGHKRMPGVLGYWVVGVPSPHHISPNCNFAASVIMPWFHGGSQTSWTFASSISSTHNSFFFTSCATTRSLPLPRALTATS